MRLFLAAANIPYQRCEQPPVLPRPTLEAIGITYRRIPLLAIGKDVYCDSSAIVAALQRGFEGLPTGAADRAYEAFADATFWDVLSVIPLEKLNEGFVKDRETIFPVLRRSDFKTLRPSSLGAFKATLDIVEKEFLGQGKPFIGGEKISLADIHVAWVIRWALQALGAGEVSGFGKADFPKVYQWVESLPKESEDMVSNEEATKIILGSQYSDAKLHVATDDPLGFPAGTAISIESTDSTPGSHPQKGTLVGLDTNEVTVELENQLRLHFPRRGYIFRK